MSGVLKVIAVCLMIISLRLRCLQHVPIFITKDVLYNLSESQRATKRVSDVLDYLALLFIGGLLIM